MTLDWTTMLALAVGLLTAVGLGYGLGRWGRGQSDSPASTPLPRPTLVPPEERKEIAAEAAAEDVLSSDRYGIRR